MLASNIIFLILSVSTFSMAGHSVQRIWTRFGVRPPYNLRGGYFCRETARRLSTVGASGTPHVGLEAAAISLGQRMAGRRCRGWAWRGPRHAGQAVGKQFRVRPATTA